MIRHSGAIKWKIRDIMVIDMRYTFDKKVKKMLWMIKDLVWLFLNRDGWQ